MHLGQLLKETILLLIAVNVIYLLLPRWLKRTIKGLTRIITKCSKVGTRYAKRVFRETYGYKKNKKATQKAVEQPSSSNNVIYITYPNGTKKQYKKAK